MHVTSRSFLRRLALGAAAVCLIAVGSAGSARADLVLQYFQAPNSPNQPFQTYYSHYTAGQPDQTSFSSTPIQVLIDLPAAHIHEVVGYMRFDNVHSVGPVTALGPGGTPPLFQNFVGTVEFNSSSSFNGTNYLTAIFTDPNDNNTSQPATYSSGSATTSSLQASSAIYPDTVFFTSDVVQVLHGTEDMQLGFSDLVPPSGTAGTTSQAFIANGTGNFNGQITSVVPEPATLAGAVVAGLAAVGLGLRRRRASAV